MQANNSSTYGTNSGSQNKYQKRQDSQDGSGKQYRGGGRNH